MFSLNDHPELDLNLMNITLVEASQQVFKWCQIFHPDHAKNSARTIREFGILTGIRLESYDLVRLLSATVKKCWHVHSSGQLMMGNAIPGFHAEVIKPGNRIQTDVQSVIGFEKIFMLLVISQRWMQVMATSSDALLQLPCSRENFASNLNLSSNEKWKAFRYFDKGNNGNHWKKQGSGRF